MPGDLVARLIVMDTGPLITLAAADCLDYLLYPGAPVYIPDAVLYEATQDSAALGATAILEWVQAHTGHVQTLSTEAFFNYVQSREANPGRRERDLGERAAIEAIHDAIELDPNERAILIAEDDRVLRRTLVTAAALTARMIPIITRGFLHGMQAAHGINSADEVLSASRDRCGRRTRKKPTTLDGGHRSRRRRREPNLKLAR